MGLNNVTQNCEMDLLLCYFDSSVDRVKVRFYNSCFLWYTTHFDLIPQFSDSTKDFNPNCIYQISVDDLNVNL